MKAKAISEQLPSTWTTCNLKYLATAQKGRLAQEPTSAPISKDDVPYLSMEYLRGETTMPGYISLGSEPLLADDGDILLLWDGSNAGEFLRAKRGAVSSTAALLVPSGIDRDFFYWACKAAESALRAETVGMGIPHVNGVVLGLLKLPIPPMPEQLKIADLLAKEAAMLDVLIGEKENLLGLLTEKRRTVVTRAVIRGLNPDAPLRDSDSPWLGQIPKHWETRRIAVLFRERDEREEPELPLLEVSINTGVVLREFSEDRIENTASDFNTYKVARKGDVVFNKMRMWQGAVGIAPEDGLVSPDYTVAEPVGKLSSDYAGQLFRADMFSAECARHSHGIVWDRLRIYWDGFRDIVVPVPPFAEQRAIVAHIQKETSKLDTLQVAAERTIGLLKERRAALITEAVTGKIKID